MASLYRLYETDSRVIKIKEKLDEDSLIMQAIEELSELSWVASRFSQYLCKYLRKKHGDNYTPLSWAKIYQELHSCEQGVYEEFLDAYLCVSLAGFTTVHGRDIFNDGGKKFINEHLDRWNQRLENKENVDSKSESGTNG